MHWHARLGPDRVRRNVALAPFTTFKIGGPADLFFDATVPRDELATRSRAARALRCPGLPTRSGGQHLGWRSWISAGSSFSNAAAQWTISDDGFLRSETEPWWPTSFGNPLQRGWSGLEHFRRHSQYGGRRDLAESPFPLSAPAAGTHGVHRRDLRSAEVLNPRRIARQSLQTGRHALRVRHQPASRWRARSRSAATFQLPGAIRPTMHRVMQENLSWRGARHPWLEWYPSAGSIFQKIEGQGAGASSMRPD